MGAHPFPAQDETTALEGLMDRARQAGRHLRGRPWLDADHVYPLSRLPHHGLMATTIALTAAAHNAIASPIVLGPWAALASPQLFLNFCAPAMDAPADQMSIGDYLKRATEIDIDIDRKSFRLPQPRRRAEASTLGRWAIQHAKNLARRRRFRADVTSPRKFLERWMTDVAGKANEWSYLDAADAPISSPRDPRLETLFRAMLLAMAPPAKRILFVLDAYRRDLLATTSSLALVASRSREIVPTQSMTPRSARPTTRNLCVIRRRPTIDRALRRARMRAAPLAAPTPHSAARASEIRTRSSSLRRSPAWRPGSGGGARTSLIAA